MRTIWIVLLAVVAATCAIPALGDTCASVYGITCSNPGTLTAEFDNDVFATFYYSSADYTSVARLVDTTKNTDSGWVLNDHNSVVGDQVDLLSVSSGDVLVLQICVHAGPVWNSNYTCDPGVDSIFASDTSSDGGHSHAQVPCDSSGCIFDGNGLNVWFEDLPSRFWGQIPNEPDYNDIVVEFSNVCVGSSCPLSPTAGGVATPEPASLILLGSALIPALLGRRSTN